MTYIDGERLIKKLDKRRSYLSGALGRETDIREKERINVRITENRHVREVVLSMMNEANDETV